tara:strand:+ start:2976 stop:3665 length:690 start_codon:yes stop_codon:yes gene_type:complete
MEVSENTYEPKLVCDKGNIILNSITDRESNQKCYNLKFDFNNLDPNKVNIKSLMGPNIYNLFEKISPELVEKIYILNIINNNETDICILMKPIAKEIGIKPKYMMFRTSRQINYNANTITFYNNDLSRMDYNLYEDYKKLIKLNTDIYDKMTFNYGKTQIKINNLNENEIYKVDSEENFTSILNINFSIDFIITIKDPLPIYMENLIGLMLKKLFHNLKLFIENINKLV